MFTAVDPHRESRVYFTHDALGNSLVYGQKFFVVFNSSNPNILSIDNKDWWQKAVMCLCCFSKYEDAEEYTKTGELNQLEF